MQGRIDSIIDQIAQVVLGKKQQITLAVSCLLARGHLLIEDLPGMGKTTLSHALANSLGLSYQRVQFTSDMLPADLLGVSIFDKERNSFQFHKGPVFSQVLLADEINRASPKTQSALLEAMAESQISVDGVTYTLPQPFFVIATQNPLDQSGTFPLPESQLDRFAMRVSLGFPSREYERKMLNNQDRPASSLDALFDVEKLVELQTQVEQVHASNTVLDYLLALVETSRNDSTIPNPLSPRASKVLLGCARAWALCHQRDFVVPDDIQHVFPYVAEHRMRGSLGAVAGQGHPLSDRILTTVDPDRP